jgi:hypothetical protein
VELDQGVHRRAPAVVPRDRDDRVIPSWWLYYATSTLQWTGPPSSSFWLKQLRDIIAVILFSIPTGLFIVVPFIIQNWRRRLRGAAGSSRPSGGYR